MHCKCLIWVPKCHASHTNAYAFMHRVSNCLSIPLVHLGFKCLGLRSICLSIPLVAIHVHVYNLEKIVTKELDYCMERRGRDESERHRAESQWIVAARPLCHLQYPVAYLSRLQRILPAARQELYFKAARTAHPPHGLHLRHVPLGAKRPLLLVGKRAAGACVASSPDSDLEAFSHNPTHGSFAPLAFQPSAMTNCANQRFLSY